jgi:TusA-related sulfurtransferase
MTEPFDPAAIRPDHVFDGGELDCGSGLILLIREHMLKVPDGGVLEMRSHEPTVGDDLPPWCRMVGHEFLGAVKEGPLARYFVRRGGNTAEEQKALEKDKERARAYEWRLRVRATGPLKSTVYCRNFSFDVGQPASFEEKDRHPSAVEVMLGALAGDLTVGFANECSRSGIGIDDVEITIKGRLGNVLAHLGLQEGDPSFQKIEVKCFASTMEAEGRVREAWERTVLHSPIASTLKRAVDLDLKLAIV